jgi:hypothetical protein
MTTASPPAAPTQLDSPTAGELAALPGNTVLYSEAAWAVVRKAADGRSDVWLTDSGSYSRSSLTSSMLLDWVTDWKIMVPAK